MKNYDGSWHGGKGSRRRRPDMEAYGKTYSNIFKKFTWLERKIITEAWLCSK